jgi:hypothetical protein
MEDKGGEAKRCLILLDCKAALEEIEREYRGCAPDKADRHALHSAIVHQLHRIEQLGGYTIFMWTPGHAGISPNAVADAIAKQYLHAQQDPVITRELARMVHDKVCLYIEVTTGTERQGAAQRGQKERQRIDSATTLSKRGRARGGSRWKEGAPTKRRQIRVVASVLMTVLMH